MDSDGAGESASKVGEKRGADESPEVGYSEQELPLSMKKRKLLLEDSASLLRSQELLLPKPQSDTKLSATDQQAQQLAADGLPTTQHSDDGVGSAVSIPKYSFFSLPLELRNEIYGYLIPTRIHIAAPEDLQSQSEWIADTRALDGECKSARLRINIYLPDETSIKAYETWIGSLPEISLRHSSIDEYVDIDWAPDGPVPLRPQEKADLYDRESKETWGYRSSNPPDFGDTFNYLGDWEMRWLQYDRWWECSAMDDLKDLLSTANDRMARLSNAVAGLDADDVRRLVARYSTNRQFSAILRFRDY
ncbi:MAG: hypothetical protein Q9221_008941 [Calogaya cf. arnoldii]